MSELKRLVSLDLGEHFGWASIVHKDGVILAAEGDTWDLTEPEEHEDRGDTLLAFQGALMILFRELRDAGLPATLVVWEHAVGANPRYIAEHGELRAVVMLVCKDLGLDFDAIGVGTWKKQVCGNGRADKKAVRETICNRFGFDRKTSQDILDAVAIGVAYAELHGGEHE